MLSHACLIGNMYYGMLTSVPYYGMLTSVPYYGMLTSVPSAITSGCSFISFPKEIPARFASDVTCEVLGDLFI